MNQMYIRILLSKTICLFDNFERCKTGVYNDVSVPKKNNFENTEENFRDHKYHKYIIINTKI